MCRIKTKIDDELVMTHQISAGRWITLSFFDGKHIYSTSFEAAGKNHLDQCLSIRKLRVMKEIKESPNPCNEIPLYPEAPPMKTINWGVFETQYPIRFEGEEPQRDLWDSKDDDLPY